VKFYIVLPTTTLTYLCNLARYWLRAPWGWHNSVETCRSGNIICQLIVHWLVIVQNPKDNIWVVPLLQLMAKYTLLDDNPHGSKHVMIIIKVI